MQQTKKAPAPKRAVARKTRAARAEGSPRRTLLIAAAVVAILAMVGAGIAIGAGAAARKARRSHDNTLALARQYLERGEFQSAQDLLNGLLLSDANDPSARALLDQLITAKKAAEEAARQEGLAAQRNQQNQLQASLDELGQNIRTSGGTERIVIQQPTPKPEDPNAAATAAEKARKKQVQDLLSRGASLFNAERYPEARKTFEDALALDPENAQALAYAGRSWFKEKPDDPEALQKAAELSNRAITKDPNLWVPHDTLGQIYEQRKLYDEAEKEYRIASRLNPGDAEILYNLGKVQYYAKRYTEAVASFDSCLKLKPSHENALFRRGMSLIQLGDRDKALQSMRAATAAKKDFHQAWYYAGVLQKENGALAGAEDALKKAVEYAPGTTTYLRELGRVQVLRGEYAAAETSFTRALELEPTHAATVADMATVKIRLGKTQDGLAWAQKAQALAPDSAQASYTLGLAHEKLGNLDEAVKYYSQAVTQDPKHVEALTNLGGLYNSRGFPEKALPLLQSALAIEPRGYAVNLNLGTSYLRQAMYAEAIARFRTALAVTPGSGIARYNLGLAYMENNQLADAEQILVELIKVDAKYWDAYLKLAQVMVNEGNQAGAKTLLDSLLQKNPTYENRDEAQRLLDKLKG
jgi:tetratricopeptide (TPR) repeat protein